MTDETYNGWTNRETWATALHIDNDEGLHAYRNELCAGAVLAEATEYLTAKQAREIQLERALQDWVETLAEEFYFEHYKPLAGMFSDIGSVWRVNWREIAENWLSDYDPE